MEQLIRLLALRCFLSGSLTGLAIGFILAKLTTKRG